MDENQAEQEEIVRKMPPDQKGLTLKEIRQMVYLDKVCKIFSFHQHTALLH